MAIVKCRECGKDVSSQAEACPHCGMKEPMPYKTNAARGRLILVVIGIVVLLAVADSLMRADKPARSDQALKAANEQSSASPKSLAAPTQVAATATPIAGPSLGAVIDSER